MPMTEIFDDVRIAPEPLKAQHGALRLQDRDCPVEVAERDRKGYVGEAILRGILHDHIDIDRMVGEGAEHRRRDARAVGDLLDGNLGLVAAVSQAADHPVLHDLILIDNKRSRRVVEARQDLEAHPMVHRQFDRARLQHPGALRCHLEHLFIGDLIQLARIGNDARIGRVDPVDIGKDVAALGLQRGGERDRRGVRPAAAQGGDAAVRADTLKPGHDSRLALGQATLDLRGFDCLNAGVAVHAVCPNGNLPAKPGPRIDAEILQRERHQAGGYLLARGDDDIILARIVQPAHPPRPFDELVGRPGHRGHDDGHFVAGIDFALHAACGIADPLDISNRGPAEFLDDTRHASLVMR